MFRPSCRSSSPFPHTDFDTWDTRSRFSAQSSAWCGTSTVSGSGFLSKVDTSTSGSTGGLRRNDPGMRRWQSLSFLAPPRPFPGAGLQAERRGESSFRQSELMDWMQDAHERLDAQLELLKSRDAELNYNMTTAQLLDMKHKQQAELMSVHGQGKEAAETSQFEKTQQRREFHEKVHQLEKDVLQMRSSLNRAGHVQPLSPEKNPGSMSKTLPLKQDDLTGEEKQQDDAALRAALRESEARAKTKEEERNDVLQKLQTSTETQRTLLNQIEEVIQKLNQTAQNYSEVQEQLSEANNKISQACLEKAALSTQVLKLEENIKELKAKFSAALSDKDHLIQEKADLQQKVIQQDSGSCEHHIHQADSHNRKQETVLMKEEAKALREANEKLTHELEMVQQRLGASHSQLQELTSEKNINMKQIADLEAERSQLIREKEKLLVKMNEGGHKELTEMRESLEALEIEKQQLQDRCLCLEAGVLEKEEKLHQQEDKYKRQDAARVQKIEELRAVASHWTQKWQKVALTLQSTQKEVEELKKNSSRNKKESDSLLKVELDACKQQLELERSRSQALLHRCKDKGGEAVQIETKYKVTDSQNKSSQLVENASGDNDEDTLKSQLEERSRKTNQLEQDNILAVQKLQTLRQLYPVKDDSSSVDSRKDKTGEVDQQRRMVAEQEREGKEIGKEDDWSAAAQAGPGSLQEWTSPSNSIMSAVDRRSWQQGSGLTPVVEEDEESDDWPETEGVEPAGRAQAETNIHNHSRKMSAMSTEISKLQAKNVMQALRLMQPIQNFLASDTSADVGVPDISPFLNEIDLHQRPHSLYPDGIFHAKLVDICRSDEEEEEEI